MAHNSIQVRLTSLRVLESQQQSLNLANIWLGLASNQADAPLVLKDAIEETQKILMEQDGIDRTLFTNQCDEQALCDQILGAAAWRSCLLHIYQSLLPTGQRIHTRYIEKSGNCYLMFSSQASKESFQQFEIDVEGHFITAKNLSSHSAMRLIHPHDDGEISLALCWPWEEKTVSEDTL